MLFMILLSTMMIPWDVTMIPQYMEFQAVRMDQYAETADCAVMVWLGLLYFPDETVFDGGS